MFGRLHGTGTANQNDRGAGSEADRDGAAAEYASSAPQCSGTSASSKVEVTGSEGAPPRSDPSRPKERRSVDSRGEPYQILEILYGGIPARPVGDGLDGHSWWPLFRAVPTEYLERYYPLRIECYEARADSGWAGYHRGGHGMSWWGVRRPGRPGRASFTPMSRTSDLSPRPLRRTD